MGADSAFLELHFETYICMAQLTVSIDYARFHLLTYLYVHQAYTYDWLLSLAGESEIISKAGLSFFNVIYFFSRYDLSSLLR